MAVAALVLGISAFVCLGPIGGILAIIFGFVGLGRAKTVGTGKGMSTAGIILGGVGTVASIALLIIFIVAAGETSKNIGGTADSSTYELSTDPGTCTVDQYGFVTFQGSIKNKASSQKNFTINTEVRNSATDVVLETTPDIVTDINPGDTAQWNVTTHIDSGVQPSCKVTSVENFFNNN